MPQTDSESRTWTSCYDAGGLVTDPGALAIPRPSCALGGL